MPRWKLIAVSCTGSLGIAVLWPVLVVSAARIEAAEKAHFSRRYPDEPSAGLDYWVSEVQAQYSRVLPLAVYLKFLSQMPSTDCGHFYARLAQLGYAVTGFVTGPDGEEFAAAISVLERPPFTGIPFKLTAFRDHAGSLIPAACGLDRTGIAPGSRRIVFRTPPRPDDEVWEFTSSGDSWKNLSGRAGFALVRERTVIDVCVTVMN